MDDERGLMKALEILSNLQDDWDDGTFYLFGPATLVVAGPKCFYVLAVLAMMIIL